MPAGTGSEREAQIERERERALGSVRGGRESAWGVVVGDEAAEAAAFGFEGVDWEGIEAAAAGVGDVIGSAAETTLVP